MQKQLTFSIFIRYSPERRHRTGRSSSVSSPQWTRACDRGIRGAISL